MNTSGAPRRRRWLRIIGIVLGVALAAPMGYGAWEYLSWRNTYIEWDRGTIERMCGGDTEEDRLTEIRFLRQWEYLAMRRAPDGSEVCWHWELSKRHCGNWYLIGVSENAVIRPFQQRFPNGAPRRQGFDCLGFQVDDSGKQYRFIKVVRSKE